MYKYLLFDADGTLLDFDRDMQNAFYSMYEAAGFQHQRPVTDALMRQYDAINNQWWARFERQQCTKEALFVGRFADFLRETGLVGITPEALNEVYFKALGQTGTVFPGALQMLQTLKTSARLFIVTNGNAQTQHLRLRRSGLLSCIEAYFISDDAGFAKPDRRYFDHVFTKLPADAPAHSIVVGDSLTSDMQGAHNAGLPGIWYNPKHAENPHGVPVTHEAENYGQVLEILKNNGNG